MMSIVPVIVHDLSPEALRAMTQVDPSQVTKRQGGPIGEHAVGDRRFFCAIGVEQVRLAAADPAF
jgi:hypothetical protein